MGQQFIYQYWHDIYTTILNWYLSITIWLLFLPQILTRIQTTILDWPLEIPHTGDTDLLANITSQDRKKRSCVRCHISYVTTHVSHVTCQLSYVINPNSQSHPTPANSPTMHSRMVCKDLKIYYFRRVFQTIYQPKLLILRPHFFITFMQEIFL